VMPDITPVQYKKLYRIYPHKISVTEDGAIESIPRIVRMILDSGRYVARDLGHGGKSVAAKWQNRRMAE